MPAGLAWDGGCSVIESPYRRVALTRLDCVSMPGTLHTPLLFTNTSKIGTLLFLRHSCSRLGKVIRSPSMVKNARPPVIAFKKASRTPGYADPLHQMMYSDTFLHL